MKETMYALVKERPEKGLTLTRVPVPKVHQNEVKIKIRKTSICGTDLHIYNWDAWSQRTIKTPMTIGHEFCGEIVELGEGVTEYKIGDIVSGEGHITCGKCRNCRAGKRHYCVYTQGVGVNRDGAFAEYLVIPALNVVPLEKGISEDLASSFDPLGNAVHCALSYDVVGEDVLITGAGPIGIMAATVCRHIGAKSVVLTDVNEYRLNLANDICKNIRTVNIAKEDIWDVRKEQVILEGFDVGLEMSGNASAFSMMVDNMNSSGNIALLGIHNTNPEIDWNKVVFNGLNVRGIYGRQMFDTWYKMMSMLKSGLEIDKILTHKFDIKDFEKGFDIMNTGNSGKVVLDWTKGEF